VKLFKFLAGIGGVILFYGVIGFISLVLVIYTDNKINMYGNRCVTADAYNFKELFKEDAVTNIDYRLGCNTYYVSVSVNDNVSENQIKALLIKYSLIKENNNIEIPIEVTVISSKPYYARLLDEGTITFVG
jgi:hypothetical protein